MNLAASVDLLSFIASWYALNSLHCLVLQCSSEWPGWPSEQTNTSFEFACELLSRFLCFFPADDRLTERAVSGLLPLEFRVASILRSEYKPARVRDSKLVRRDWTNGV